MDDFEQGIYHGTDADARSRLNRISSVVYKHDCPVRFLHHINLNTEAHPVSCRLCIEYAKRINELQTIARRSSFADMLRYINTYATNSVANLVGGKKDTHSIAANFKARQDLAWQLTKNMMITAATSLDAEKQKHFQEKFTLDYVRKLLDWTIWLKLPGLGVSDALQNVPFQAMLDKYLDVFAKPSPIRARRGPPGVGAADSKVIEITWLRDNGFNPDLVFPSVKKVEEAYVKMVDKLRGVLVNVAPNKKTKLQPEHASAELAKCIRDRLAAFMLAYAAAYVFGISREFNQHDMATLVQETFTACIGHALRADFTPQSDEGRDQEGYSQPVITFVNDVKFLCDLKSQAMHANDPTAEIPLVDLAMLLNDGAYALAVFLAVLPLIRTGRSSTLFTNFRQIVSNFEGVISA